MEGGEVGCEGDGDVGGLANGAAGEDEGAAGVARGRREEVDRRRGARRSPCGRGDWKRRVLWAATVRWSFARITAAKREMA
jgi:hypothetical protein